eukprot:GHVQ01005174.1.p1 GENE.GHVQ01005174.1~~GHVQ01005174.1.p1  ORF type:complete len:246 (+),score=31.32 GHVQ01005174.1:112-849(+)
MRRSVSCHMQSQTELTDSGKRARSKSVPAGLCSLGIWEYRESAHAVKLTADSEIEQYMFLPNGQSCGSSARKLSSGSCYPPSTDASPILSVPNPRIIRVTRIQTPIASPLHKMHSSRSPHSSSTSARNPSLEEPLSRLFGPSPFSNNSFMNEDFGHVSEEQINDNTAKKMYRSLSNILHRYRHVSTDNTSAVRVPMSRDNNFSKSARSVSSYERYLALHVDKWREDTYDKVEIDMDDCNGGCAVM